MGFPGWFVAIIVAASGVWIAGQWNPAAAWGLAVLILLSVLVFRPDAIQRFEAFMEMTQGA